MKNIIKKINSGDNLIYLIIFVNCLIFMLVFAINETNIFIILKNYLLDTDFRDNYWIVEGGKYVGFNPLKVIINVLGEYNWKFDYIIIWGTNFFQTLIPIFASIAGFLFYRDFHSIYKNIIYRIKNYRSFIVKEISVKSLKISLSIFSAYISFFLIILIITKGELNNTITRELFLDILGKEFYSDHTYLYYLLDGFVRFFLIPFIYSFFSCSISMFLKTKKQVLFAPILYYFGLSVVAVFTGYLIGHLSIYINPITIMISGSYNDINTYYLTFINILPILISVIVLKRNFKNVEV